MGNRKTACLIFLSTCLCWPLAGQWKMHRIDGSSQGADGVRLADVNGDNLPDIIVLDLRMPGIDGMEVLRRVKQFFPSIQVIILTGHGNDLDEAEARKLGSFDYLRKPVDIELLVDRIRAAYHEMNKGGSMSAVAFAEAGEFDTATRMAR